MGIVDEDVVRVRETADIVQVISAHTQLKKQGTSWMGLCPFHGEKSPSFSVSQEKGVYYCFGCQVRGDAISFVRDMEHLDFQAAVEQLAGKFGIALRYTDKNEGERREARGRLREAMAAAVDWYHDRLLTAPDAGAARRYLRERGLDGAAVRKYRIGWAPDDWSQLVRALKYPPKTLRDAGLGVETRNGGTNDFFRGRILFPIFDSSGDPIGFGGRMMPEGRPPKYKNTPETALYRKSKVLYGLNWAKAEAVRENEVIICEGYTDVIGFAHVGLDRAVATCGTALTDEHVRALRLLAPRLVLAFDPDAAGQAAAERVYEWEKKHEVEVAVAALPPGADPADLSRSDPDRLREAVEKATPFLGFRVERILDGANLRTPEGRAKAAESALAAIVEHPSEFVRDQYVMAVASRCQLDPDRLRSSLRSGRIRPVVRVEAAKPRRRRADTPETEGLRLAVANPGEMLPLLDEVLFEDESHRAVLRALQEADGDFHAATEAADPFVAEHLARLAVEESEAEPGDVRRMLIRNTALVALRELERDFRTAADPAPYGTAIGWLKTELEAVGPDAPPDRQREDELLLWLAQRAEDPHE
ncbi:DNA primase [Aquihabitans sp. G128]|uniref:DNA primase n=1 Tax=Aquihabitans sp. G128 TaxID=2849779 RepID=UPI001C231E88|nr:DNA primase [Aquihabitans sp. G128]QXC62380.1 DNA primase [Aquihabitans sp. G128]